MRALKAGERDQNDAFTSGLLQDVGILILAHHFPEPYDAALDLVANLGCQLPLAEQRVLQVNHAEVGAYLIGLWGLPAVIVQSVQFHHRPALVPGGLDRITPVCAVHLADGFYAETSSHLAFQHSILDPALAQQPWLSGQLERLRQGASH